jgi:hypothetical protein
MQKPRRARRSKRNLRIVNAETGEDAEIVKKFEKVNAETAEDPEIKRNLRTEMQKPRRTRRSKEI